MILYGSSLSPFVRKVMVTAMEKGIAYELRPMGLGARDPAFRAASPFGKMPAIDDDGYRLADSSAIVAYLDARQPEPALIPAEAKARGKTIWWDEFADTILFACIREMFFNRVIAPRFQKIPGDLDAAEKAERETLPPLLDYLEREASGAGFLVDDRMTLADIAVASCFVNLRHAGGGVDAAGHPKLHAYLAAIHARPAFADTIAHETRALAA